MIGWRDSLNEIETQRKIEGEIEALMHNRIELGSDLYKAQIVSKFHTFYWLIGILRHGKDEFITHTGDLVSLDLDRSNYKKTIDPRSSSLNYTWCYNCYMDEELYENFLYIYQSDMPLSKLMEKSLSYDKIYSLYYGAIGKHLDLRVELILDCITDCITIFERENVLLKEKRTSASHIISSFEEPKERYVQKSIK